MRGNYEFIKKDIKENNESCKKGIFCSDEHSKSKG